MEVKLRDYFYNPRRGGANMENLRAFAHKEGIPSKDVESWYKNQEIAQIHKPINQPKVFFPIVGPLGLFNVDLTFYDQLSTRNKGYKAILTCIEINTRRAYARPLKTKTSKEVNKAFESVIQEAMKWVPIQTVFSDEGSEFLAGDFKKLLKKHSIDSYTVNAGDHHANGVIERFNRTLRNRIEKHFSITGSLNWVDSLQAIVDNYNNTRHSSLKTSPNKASRNTKLLTEARADDQEQIVEALQNEDFLAVGDIVRRFRPMKLLEKKAQPSFYKTLYRVKRRNPFSYSIESLEGVPIKRTYQRYLLQKVDKEAIQQAPVLQQKAIKDLEAARERAAREAKTERALKELGTKRSKVVALHGIRPTRKVAPRRSTRVKKQQ